MARAESEESMSRMENLRPRLTNDIHVMLVGPAGAGKSSLIKSLIQLCKSSDGSVPCDYSYIPPTGGGMLGEHTLMRQTVDSINTLTFTNNLGWHDWSNKTAVEGLTAQIRGEIAIDDVDGTDTEGDSSPLKHPMPMIPHLTFSEVDYIAVVLNGQAGIDGIDNCHGLVDACRKDTRRRPSFLITHKDTMSGEQIEQMKTALETKYGLDPYNIFFIENITTPNQKIVDVDWKSRLCEFLEVCAADGKVGADFHRRRENTMLKTEEGQHKDKKKRIENEIVDAKCELDTMNIRVAIGQRDATANKMIHLAQKQVDKLNSELTHAEEMHLLKTECIKARQNIRETRQQQGLKCKMLQLQIGELQQKLQKPTAICDSLIDKKASLQNALVGATARVHVHKEQTYTRNTEGEENEEGKAEDNIVMGNIANQKDEVNVKPIKMECRKRVGVEGGKLQLDSFGIELEIPPDAIDSKAPQDISLRVLTDTRNIANRKEEVSVCFGVECLAPDDLVLKLPVTYTIPHCAVITGTRVSDVKAVLYTGKGESPPERIKLPRPGTPSFIITKDIFKLQMNHFSLVKIKLRKFQEKNMCCRSFKKRSQVLQKTRVNVNVHLYDDIKGNSEFVQREEGKQGFIPAYMEQPILIQKSSGDLKMTCYVKAKVMGKPRVVSVDKLMGETNICEPFEFDFSNQSDSVAVSLQIGQHKKQKIILFEMEDRRDSASPQDQGKQEDFDDKLKEVAKGVVKHAEIDNLGKALGFKPEEIQRYVETNTKNAEVSYMGTLSMLRAWSKKQTKATECEALQGVLNKAGQIRLADEQFGTS